MKKIWIIRLPDRPGFWTVEAHTKSEARAEVKRILKLDRLPIGATVTIF